VAQTSLQLLLVFKTPSLTLSHPFLANALALYTVTNDGNEQRRRSSDRNIARNRSGRQSCSWRWRPERCRSSNPCASTGAIFLRSSGHSSATKVPPMDHSPPIPTPANTGGLRVADMGSDGAKKCERRVATDGEHERCERGRTDQRSVPRRVTVPQQPERARRAATEKPVFAAIARNSRSRQPSRAAPHITRAR